MNFTFPENFVWGVSSSSYQIEGAATEGGKGASIWDTFSHIEKKILGGDTGDVACDHYHRYKDDLALMAELRIPTYHFSISWPRIQPNGRGRGLQAGLDFYNALVDTMLERGMSPWATLYHWDLPQVLQDKGGWTERDCCNYFADYVEILFRALGDRVPMWFTHNEPWVASYLGYGMGIHAPGIQDYAQSVQAAHNILLSHGKAVQVFRSLNLTGKIGLNPNLHPAYPASDAEQDQLACRRVFEHVNAWFLDALFKGSYPNLLWDYYEKKGITPDIRSDDMACISVPIDFLGVNYYSRLIVRWDEGAWLDAAFQRNETAEHTAMDWEVYPEGLIEVLSLANRYTDIDLYVVENGAAYEDRLESDGQVHDTQRVEFLRAHISAAWKAVQAGLPLRGYCVWSFMDNFEWAEGYSKRFGLIYVDYKTQKRIPKDSAYFFRDLISRNGLTE